MGERCVRIAEVEGSNPLLSTKGESDKRKNASASLYSRKSPFSAANRQTEGGIWGCTGFDGDVETG